MINENDTTATDEISFGDNDFLAAQVAVLIGADELILLTDIDGLLHRRSAPAPRRAAGRRGRATSPRCDELEIGHTTSPLGSGGMRSKVVAAEMATAAGHRDDDLQRPATTSALRRCSPAGAPGRGFTAREARYS